MAKQPTTPSEDRQRQSRKEILIARKEANQTRQINLAIGFVVLLLLVVLVTGLVYVFVITPSAPVANVNGTEITMKDWRERVSLQRAQLILGVEDLAEAVEQDIGQVQQFANQQLLLLTQESERLGQIVLDQMIDEELILKEAGARGISVSEGEIQRELEESFGYFGGASPTQQPTATDTAEPTPSLTPIPTAIITELLPTNTPFPTFTPGPSATPFPTPTAVSEEAFNELFKETSDRLADLGVTEDDLRQLIRAQLYRERLLEALVSDAELAEEEEQASFFYLQFGSEEEAEDAVELIEADGYDTFWNTIRSMPPDPEAESSTIANEIIWRTWDNISLLFDESISSAAFETPIDEVSAVILVPGLTEEEEDRYYIILVTGRDVRPLSDTAIQTAEQELMNSWLQSNRVVGVESFERWRSNIPVLPAIDTRFLVPPTPTPFIALEETPELGGGDE